MGNEYSTQTLKVKTKMASQRLKTHISKKENMLVKNERLIGQLISDEKLQSARIKIEGILREENLIRVMEWLEMMCDLMNQRINQIAAAKQCPEDLHESICTIIYCAKRISIPELTEIAGQFKGKWGDKWFASCTENKSGRVSRSIIDKLSPLPPKRENVDKKMQQIADKYDIPYNPEENTSEEMPAFVAHRDEYTVEFTAKPFGMEWTATEDGKNLYVSNVTPMSQSARTGVVPGSMLVALNGIDIQNIGAPDIHSRASKFGLPLRVTFRKASSLHAPKKKKDFSIREDVVNACVAKLKSPQSLDYNAEQKAIICKQCGANEAETASAIFLASYMIEQQQIAQKQQQQQMYPPQQQPVYSQQPQYGQPMQWNGQQMPYQNQNNNGIQPMQQQPVYPSPAEHPQSYTTRNQVEQPVVQPMEPPPNDDADADAGGLTDLEARFAALQKGL